MDSKLQIISGSFRGRKLRRPPDARPTQNMARVALFNMLESGIINPANKISVWDAFAGSGAFGIECLSRYPNAAVIFSDTAPTSIKTVRDNLATLNIGLRATVTQTDAIATIPKYGLGADLIFVDPPYANADDGHKFIKKLGRVARAGTVVVWEQDGTCAADADAATWETLRDKKYGRARFLILRRRGE